MKAILISFILLFFSVFSFAEYQVYSFSMTIQRPEMKLLYSSSTYNYQKTYSLKSEKISGYLVTVCCYPCGADFGKCYPSWLYLKRNRDETNSLWKIQCKVSGGVFGDRISPKYMQGSDSKCHPEFNQVTVYDYSNYMDYVKKTNKSFVTLEFDGDENLVSKKFLVVKPKNAYNFREGFGGIETKSFSIICTGFGSAGWKWNYKASSVYDQFNIYIKNASGYLVGHMMNDNGFGYDPSNYYIEYEVPICGTFKMIFNNKLTEELRGTADWDILDERMYKHLEFDDIITEEYDEEIIY